MTIHVPFPAGSSSNVFARTLSTTLARQARRTLDATVESLHRAFYSTLDANEAARFENAAKQANLEMN